MLSTSPPEKMDQIIAVFSQRLQPLAIQRLSVAEILQDGTALAIMQEDIPSIDCFHIDRHQKACFGRMLKFLHLDEPTGYEKDEEHKRAAVRYLALRTMLQHCRDVKISTIQGTCMNKLLRWFEDTETNAFVSPTTSSPILPPRMSPKKPCIPPIQTLDKSSSETSFHAATTTVSSGTVAAKLEKYKMPDLRASHIRRIAELRSRGADISDKVPLIEENDNSSGLKPQPLVDFQNKEVENRMVEATFKLYHPETDAEREMNVLWIRRRQEEEIKRKKDEEVQQRVQKWSMDRSRDESENLRKRESTKLVAGLGQILQEGVDQEKPFAWRSTRALHPDLVAAASNQSAAAVNIHPTEVSTATKEGEDATTHKREPPQPRTSVKPAQIVIKTRKPSVIGGGGMHFRNQLPPNYVPPGLLAASSVPKSRREVSSADPSTRSSSNSKEHPFLFSKLEKSSSGISDEASSASEDEEDPATDDSVKRKRMSVSQKAHQMKLQSYHVPYYYDDTDHLTVAKTPALQKPHPRGTIPEQPLPADPELRCLQEASAMRRVFVIPIDKVHLQKPLSVLVPASGRDTGREVSSSRKSARPEKNKSERGSKLAKAKRAPSSSRSGVTLPRPITVSGAQYSASTSDLRQSQLEEMEKIRRLFEENNLSLPAQALERGLLVPEDRPLLETITNLPFPGSRLLSNPLTRRSKSAKAKKKAGTKKKKGKKGKKGPKTPKSSRRASGTKGK